MNQQVPMGPSCWEVGIAGPPPTHISAAAATQPTDAAASLTAPPVALNDPNPPLRPLPRQHDAEEEPQCTKPN
jgi:hypothetical protein